MATSNTTGAWVYEYPKASFTRKLVCINYPGFVNNVDKMIETLGGLSTIENYVGGKRKNMELRFRPNDKFCKPVMSDLDKKPGILLKITTKDDQDSAPECEIVGITALTYSFNKLCDFQYLPLVAENVVETPDTSLSYVYNKIIPDYLPDYNWLTSEESQKLTFYLPPAIFSRFDNPQNNLYFDRSKFYEGRFKPEYAKMLRQQELDRKNQKTIEQKVISKKSGHGAIFYSFHDSVVPESPPRLALQFVNMRYTNKGAYEKIKELFEERPIWSRTAILYISQVPKEQLKFILPAIAYHYHNGPWRVMWVRYGYDPKQDPSSRIYQTFDFRVRATAGLKVKVQTKRYYQTQRYISRIGGYLQKVSLSDVCDKPESNSIMDESTFILKPGMIPPARQMFYQYCDVHLPEIQTMIHRLPPVLPGTKCDYKNGWLPSKFTDHCREIVNKYITEQVQKEIFEENKKHTDQESNVSSSEISKSINENQSKGDDLLEISDSDSDTESNFSLLDEKGTSSDEDYIPSKRPTKTTKENEDDDDDDEIDLEAAADINKILGDNMEALAEFDKLVYDSDSD